MSHVFPTRRSSDHDSFDDPATAASKAVPTWRRISRPESVASSWPEAIATPGGSVAGAAVLRGAAIAGANASRETSNRWAMEFMRTPLGSVMGVVVKLLRPVRGRRYRRCEAGEPARAGEGRVWGQEVSV